MSKRIYLNRSKIEYAKRKEKSNKDLMAFREGIDSYKINTADDPTEASVSFDLYDSLLGAEYGLKEKPELIGVLFGVKIYIDPMLKENEIVFRPHTPNSKPTNLGDGESGLDKRSK